MINKKHLLVQLLLTTKCCNVFFLVSSVLKLGLRKLSVQTNKKYKKQSLWHSYDWNPPRTRQRPRLVLISSLRYCYQMVYKVFSGSCVERPERRITKAHTYVSGSWEHLLCIQSALRIPASWRCCQWLWILLGCEDLWWCPRESFLVSGQSTKPAGVVKMSGKNKNREDIPVPVALAQVKRQAAFKCA